MPFLTPASISYGIREAASARRQSAVIVSGPTSHNGLLVDVSGGAVARKGSAIDSFCAWDGDTLVLNVLGTPSAGRDAIGKPKGHQLKISVTATPVAGKATDHMVRFLAREFGVTPNDIEVVFGRYNVNKQLRIRSPAKLPAVIEDHLPQRDTEAKAAAPKPSTSKKAHAVRKPKR